MIARYRRKRKYLMFILLIGIITMSVGFSAFSSELTISSSAIVKPDSSAFRVVFSSSNTQLLTNGVTGTVTGDATAGTATIDNTGDTPTISNLTATFTEPGQSVSYTFYAYNSGAYVAYLTAIKFNNVSGESSAKVCTAIDSNSVSSDLMSSACEDINVTIDVGDTTSVMSSTSGITGHSLGKGIYEKVVVTIEYVNNYNSADGDFTVEFGDIGLSYSTVEPAKLITFTINGTSYTAEDGMTWTEWVNSDYNTSGFVIDGDYIRSSGGFSVVSVSPDLLIVESSNYTLSTSAAGGSAD